MTLPVVELSKDDARKEAESYLLMVGIDDSDVRADEVDLLSAIFQRIYAEGVCAGHDRAAAIVKGLK